MPRYWARKVQDALNEVSKSLKGSHVLVLGVAYKKDVSDLRESPALDFRIMIQQAVDNKIPFHYVLTDVWYASADHMRCIKQTVAKGIVTPLKRKIAFSATDKQHGCSVQLRTLDLREADLLNHPIPAPCHPERSEGSLKRQGEMLRCAQHDMSSGCLSISTSLSDLTQSRKACVPGFNGQAETCPSVRVDSFSM